MFSNGFLYEMEIHSRRAQSWLMLSTEEDLGAVEVWTPARLFLTFSSAKPSVCWTVSGGEIDMYGSPPITVRSNQGPSWQGQHATFTMVLGWSVQEPRTKPFACGQPDINCQ